MTFSGSPLSSIWCWASSTSSLPGWASSAFSSSGHRLCGRGQGLLQPLLWTGTVVQPAGWTLRPLPAGRYSPVDEKQGVPLRVFGLFLLMFFQMLWSTYLVFAGAQELRQAVTLLWTFRLPWHWAYYGTLFSPALPNSPLAFTASCSPLRCWGWSQWCFSNPAHGVCIALWAP